MLYDVQQIRIDNKKEFNTATPFYNLPYPLAKFKKQAEEKKNWPKGTFFVLTPNGSNPLNRKKK